jgi:hypothetical protein
VLERDHSNLSSSTSDKIVRSRKYYHHNVVIPLALVVKIPNPWNKKYNTETLINEELYKKDSVL